MLIAWAVGLVIAFGLSAAFGGESANGATAPGSDSEQAQRLLGERFPAQSGDTVRLVVRANDVTSPEVQRGVGALLGELGRMPHVASVEDPYAARGSIAPDGRTLAARVYLDVTNPNDMPVEDTQRLLAAADAAERDGLEIALGGRAVQLAEATQSGSELIGLLAAAVILLIMFGSVVAAGLPLAMAIGGLAVSASLVGLVAAVVDVPDFAPIIGMTLGIALGIDYALLLVTRFREWRAVGLDPEAATVATLDTAGRAVLVAGGTVMVSMSGLFAVGLSIMNGTAVVTMVATLVVMVAALTLFPALLGYLGRRIDRLRVPLGRRRAAQISADGHLVPAAGWARWSRLVQRHNVFAIVTSVALLLALAAPFLGVHFGLPDAGNDPEGTSNRRAYDMLAEGFGPGENGPLLVVAEVSPADGDAALQRLQAEFSRTAGVAAVSPPRLNPAGDTALITVVPTAGPQEAATEDLVQTLRDDVIPAATKGTRTDVHVGGATAAVIDLNTLIANRLALLIGGVVVVSMLLLLVAFRSVVIAVTAAVMNLLSVAASYGVVAFFLEGGWAGKLVGIDTATPMAAFVPVIMFALLFGLSMDYEVFLISRVRESWVRTQDNGRAIVTGLASTGRVITAAAAIMIVVFAAIVPSDQVFIKVFGLGMVAAILVDATVIRMLLVPAVMHLLGRSNWWLPRVMERHLPQLHVEGAPDTFLRPVTDAEPVPSR
ncbi:putative drug exporter of the RND superfamily [Micromonospora rhizosphaerae]|uniref:Putative drug exporter of the RND superfamily n=1 Tax=Micromonospora rhizosphaerae TaxID=568872 RepID=A0A1C6SYX6_9ACTN|nr:MMPL family transporter [Micromonospora rhizosphaerae]SCL34569.1 putative drug exporter of the RND superfamily [Micromonospora rhizosphaerae]